MPKKIRMTIGEFSRFCLDENGGEMEGGIEGGMDLLKRPCRKGYCSKKGGMGDFQFVFARFYAAANGCQRGYGSLPTSRNLSDPTSLGLPTYSKRQTDL
jgi:hypothetical protein